MEITVNGKAFTAPPDSTVASLLVLLGITGERVAVERNLDIIPRERFGSTALAPGDTVEVIHFVGGGAQEART